MTIKVLVTGAAGQIAYSLTYMIAKGLMFGPNEKVILHLLDIPQMITNLGGLVMELEDCCFPTLEKVIATADLKEAFSDIDVACMVGAMPRREGMERKDLLKANVNIFKEQGSALDQYAKKTVKVVVVGNPANTNAYVMSRYAPSIPKENFSALTRLDHNRAIGQIALAAKQPCDAVKNVIIWGNHSSTQFADVKHGTVGGKAIYEVISDDKWLKSDFLKMIQTRGAAVISARKLSSAMSAAKAITDHVHDWWCGTKPSEYVSMAVMSKGQYGAPEDVMFSFPVTIKDKQWTVVQNLDMDDWAKEQISVTGKELLAEKNDALAFVE